MWEIQKLLIPLFHPITYYAVRQGVKKEVQECC